MAYVLRGPGADLNFSESGYEHDEVRGGLERHGVLAQRCLFFADTVCHQHGLLCKLNATKVTKPLTPRFMGFTSTCF